MQNTDSMLQEHAKNSVQNDKKVDETREKESGEKNKNQNTTKNKTLKKTSGINGKASFKYTALKIMLKNEYFLFEKQLLLRRNFIKRDILTKFYTIFFQRPRIPIAIGMQIIKQWPLMETLLTIPMCKNDLTKRI